MERIWRSDRQVCGGRIFCDGHKLGSRSEEEEWEGHREEGHVTVTNNESHSFEL